MGWRPLDDLSLSPDDGSAAALVTWQIWKERNARCFRSEVSLVESIVFTIVSNASEWARAGAKALGCILSE
ncbi:hypothetical protein BS78_02G336300 [Paspalum vaginatum]|nr:hypothetical protein BS78_02G336300 [Paspalum vaginatum]